MRQITRYLYEYEGKTRIQNIGFVKAEIAKEQCAVRIYGRNRITDRRSKMAVYIFYSADGKRYAVLQGYLEQANASMNYVLQFSGEDIGKASGIEAVEGLLLCEDNGKKYAALWEDGGFDADHIIFEEEAQEAEEEEEAQDEERRGEIPEESKRQEETEQREETEEPECAEEPQESVASVQDVEAASVQTSCRKIQRQDMVCLARKEWRIANNSFLLHGYYNYHHLVLIEEGEQLYLGVPGVYHERERRAAAAFGFTGFYRLREDELELTEEEKNPADDFGYWCRPVQRGNTDESGRKVYERGNPAGEKSVCDE